MLTRMEVEGGLRSLDPMRFQARRMRRVRTKARRRVRTGFATLFGVLLIAAIAAVVCRSAAPRVATLQDTEWADGYTRSYRRQDHPPLFPPLKRSPWDSFVARSHSPRDPITGERHHAKLARE
ncbi:MAG TPA: hypothetical protein VGK30_18740 [Candidatus Binatia bacterium]|jgi:hypothetical protein